ncbi:hypothetical protein MLD38_019271 [Melastoma candidum]|uniref:Uncharacterized protein n=1 Tax=Melastoma candidum TaxID=119954 RepID=A0ACB9QWJ9_9MYRT|nr:hypothetical protein MLD38_019271 [Melastoma candidum]
MFFVQHSCTEGDFEDIQNKETERGCQHLDINNTEVDQQLLFVLDSTSSEDVENKSPSQHDMETIFSPVADPNELSGSTCHLSMPALDSVEIYGNKSSCDYQTCSISDFYMSDVIIASIPPHGDAICKESDDNDDDDTNEMKTVDYRCNESDDADNTGKESSSLYLSVDEIIAGTSESQCNSEIEDLDRFDPQLFIRTLPDLSDEVTSSQSDPLRSSEEKRKSVTLVLDLDETLVHSTLDYRDDADFTFTVFFNMAEHVVYVKKRPHVQTFLERVADMFNVVIFTASQSIYAGQLLDILDPNQQLISHRVYRESCTFSDGTYTKDLNILGVDLAKVAIIDNSPQVFRLQVNNGIPIKSWFDDPSDCALLSLLPFLETLVDVDDVRPIIARRYGNQE